MKFEEDSQFAKKFIKDS